MSTPEGRPTGHGFEDRLMRTVQVALLLGVVAISSQGSEYNDPAMVQQLPYAEQAFDSIPMVPSLTDGWLSGGSDSIKLPSETPMTTLNTPESESDPRSVTSTPRSISSDSPITHTQTQEIAKPEKATIPVVPISRPTYLIAPEILNTVRSIGEVKSQHNPDGSWSITPPEATNDELQMAWWWNEHSEIGTDMKGTGYIYAHACHEGASIQCAGDNFHKLEVGNKLKVGTENGTIELTVVKAPFELPKTAEGIGSSDIYDYNNPGLVWLITCGYRNGGVSDINWAVATRVTSASTQKYQPSVK